MDYNRDIVFVSALIPFNIYFTKKRRFQTGLANNQGTADVKENHYSRCIMDNNRDDNLYNNFRIINGIMETVITFI